VTDKNLRFKLESGASRVFNCLQITRRLLERQAEAGGPSSPLFFTSRHLNNIVLIKEPNTTGVSARDTLDPPLPVRTKLFIPYNAENPYEGGESVVTDDPRFKDALRHLVGDGADAAERFERDFEKIRVLEQLPSLDPFLMKDKFALAGVQTSEDYFRLSEEEWRNIRAHICERFALMCRFAMNSHDDVNVQVVDRLVDRIWEAKKLEPLHPLLAAFGLPTDRAGEFFYCWKGVSYFDYEFTRNTTTLRSFSAWIQSVQPRGPAHRDDSASIERDRAHIRTRMRLMVSETLGVLKEFNDSFDMLFRKRQTAKNFSAFMLNSKKHFWTLGNNLNGVYHVLSLWRQATARSIDQTLPPAQLVRLLRILAELV
jgi:hypothetical protein